ncbi:MAG: BsuPI-related putative proteinase inhibitor [Gemmatimonadota bacterium]|jgi:hypothetical protein|nr:BsuPI-related putative proteinase inhibitor [Gemmatimonadota bacterium]MDQ8147759.1 BsuPI-related putative proteinase inhibitor [Gemmatimonadota bacterium]MDQ8149671.1 BsuPI-related putative proteinase inhibitor [Gemmatimonadota bacterium]MDQ8177511.1 BsuPI-related putative proteinase inhibitor [Gemmatimonadota bacterium]
MIPRLPLGLLSAALLSFACGPRGRSEAHAADTGTGTDPRLAISVTDDVRLTLEVPNPGERAVDVEFPDGQTHDFAVEDASGRTVWRWSEGRLFTQGVQTKVLRAGKSLTYEARWEPAAPGRYTVVATLRSSTLPVTRSRQIVVPAR